MRTLALGPILLLLMILAGFAAGLIFRRRRGNFVGGDPLCGKCNYCVRGLEGSICPECGSDLRQVGVLMPGTRKPLSPVMRVLVWSLFAPLPILALCLILLPLVGPQWMVTTQRRVIFSQAPYCNVIITAHTSGKKLVFGRPGFNATHATPEVMFLSWTNPNAGMQIDLPGKTFRYPDATGKLITGNFDAIALEKWLNAGGFTDPRVADRAADIVTAINEIGTPAEKRFSRFPPTSPPGVVEHVVAHPTFTFSQPRANEATIAAGAAIALFVWGTGAIIAWRRRPPLQHFAVNYSAHAEQEPAHS